MKPGRSMKGCQMKASSIYKILFLLMAAISLFACIPQREDTVSAA